MRVKAVLRDSKILQSELGSKTRIISTAKKNVDRVVNLTSLLKVMGLKPENRIDMLKALEDTNLHIWLLQDPQQDLVFLSREDTFQDANLRGYKWQ
ncbi:MAG: hypothetical protein ACW975_00650 [Candidatus Thorarchaeota archaeon]